MRKQPFLLPGILYAILFSVFTVFQLTSLMTAGFVVGRMLGMLLLRMVVLVPVMYCFILWKSKGGRIAWRICLMVVASFFLIDAVVDLLMLIQSVMRSRLFLQSQNDILRERISVRSVLQLFFVLLLSAVFFLTAIMNKKPCQKTCMITNGLTITCFVCLMIYVISLMSLDNSMSLGRGIFALFVCLLLFAPIFMGIISINCGEYRLYRQSNKNHGL